jgi:hypothetical protein
MSLKVPARKSSKHSTSHAAADAESFGVRSGKCTRDSAIPGNAGWLLWQSRNANLMPTLVRHVLTTSGSVARSLRHRNAATLRGEFVC